MAYTLPHVLCEPELGAALSSPSSSSSRTRSLQASRGWCIPNIWGVHPYISTEIKGRISALLVGHHTLRHQLHKSAGMCGNKKSPHPTNTLTLTYRLFRPTSLTAELFAHRCVQISELLMSLTNSTVLNRLKGYNLRFNSIPLRGKSCASGMGIADVQQLAHALDAGIILSLACSAGT
jgi:hypothetical protein